MGDAGTRSEAVTADAAGADDVTTVDVVVVGAGFAGLYALHRLRGLGLTTRVFEAASGVGGTWWWNRYPGARCDILSQDYSYSFDPELDQEWTWSERYAAQPEILSYAEHVADRHDLRRDITFDTRVTRAVWSDDGSRWRVDTDSGEHVAARWLVMAVGCLSAAKRPEIDGIDDFAGVAVHTGQWPHEGVDLAGKRVGVIGTGSSGIQSIPIIAEQAAHTTVFQRTPGYAQPARNRSIPEEEWAGLKADYPAYRQHLRASSGGTDSPKPTEMALATDPEAREQRFREGWEQGTLFSLLGAYLDLLVDRDANETVSEFVRERIRETVDDPEVAEALCPHESPFGTKRVCLDTGYYATYNRPDVTLVDLRRTPIEAIVPEGVRTTEGLHELDVLVFATGFDAMTGPLLGPEIVGRGGRTLREAWAEGPRSYLGLCVAGFPDLFTVTGPGSPSVLTNMLVSIEQHVEWITDAIAAMEADGTTLEADLDAQDEWVAHVNELAEITLFPQGNSWYLGANVPGKPRVFMPYLGGVAHYRSVCDEVAAAGYRGFTRQPANDASPQRVP